MDSFPARLSLCLGLLGRRHEFVDKRRDAQDTRVYMS